MSLQSLVFSTYRWYLTHTHTAAPQMRSCTSQACFWLPAPRLAVVLLCLVVFPFWPGSFPTAHMARCKRRERLGTPEAPLGASTPRSATCTSPAAPEASCAGVCSALSLSWEPLARMPRVFSGPKPGHRVMGPALLLWSALTPFWSPQTASDWSRVGCASKNKTFLVMSQPIVSYNLWFHFVFTILLCNIFNLISLKVPRRKIIHWHAVGKLSHKSAEKVRLSMATCWVAEAGVWCLAQQCLLHLAGQHGCISPFRLSLWSLHAAGWWYSLSATVGGMRVFPPRSVNEKQIKKANSHQSCCSP